MPRWICIQDYRPTDACCRRLSDTVNGVFDAAGRQLGTYPSRDDRQSYGWTSPTKVLGIVEANRIALNTVPLAGGTPVRIPMLLASSTTPQLSADGKRAAMTRRVSATTMEVIPLTPMAPVSAPILSRTCTA